MSFSIAFQTSAAKQNQPKTNSARKIPHSKTFVGNPLTFSSKKPEINEIEEKEEIYTETDEMESQNTFVFDEKSSAKLSIKEQVPVIPASHDFISFDKDYELLDSWDFNIIEVTNIMEKYRLIGTMFRSLGYFEKFEIDLSVFGKFVHTLQEKYNIRSNPFHNFDHGFTGKISNFFLN